MCDSELGEGRGGSGALSPQDQPCSNGDQGSMPSTPI
jgi:hypothetical protein